MRLPRPDCHEDRLLAAMCRHPILVSRPNVCTPRDVRLCRPSEDVLAQLDAGPHYSSGAQSPSGANSVISAARSAVSGPRSASRISPFSATMKLCTPVSP